MDKIIAVIFFGATFGLFPIIIFYGGIFVHYFSYYEIKEYFNSFFTQNLNIYLYVLFGLFSGIAFVLNRSFLRSLYLVCVILFSFTFIPSIGVNMGERMFGKNARINIDGQSQSARLIYKDNMKIYYKLKDSPKIQRIDRRNL